MRSRARHARSRSTSASCRATLDGETNRAGTTAATFRRPARRRPCWRSTPMTAATWSCRSRCATPTCAPTPARSRCPAERSTRPMRPARPPRCARRGRRSASPPASVRDRRRPRRRLDPGQQLRAAALRRHRRRRARRSCRTTPRSPRSSSCRSPRCSTPRCWAPRSSAARGFAAPSRRVSIRRRARVGRHRHHARHAGPRARGRPSLAAGLDASSSARASSSSSAACWAARCRDDAGPRAAQPRVPPRPAGEVGHHGAGALGDQPGRRHVPRREAAVLDEGVEPAVGDVRQRQRRAAHAPMDPDPRRDPPLARQPAAAR